jgi:hypothetical protein
MWPASDNVSSAILLNRGWHMCAIFAAKTLSFQNVQLNDDVHRFLLFPLNEGSALKVRLSVNAYLPQPPTLHPARILIFCASAQLHYQAMC